MVAVTTVPSASVTVEVLAVGAARMCAIPDDEPLPEAVIVKGLIDSASSFTLVAEMPHYIKLSRTAPAKFEQLRLLIEFMHQVTKE